MDDIGKFLAKLTNEERDRVLSITSRLLKADTEGLDIKKLRGHGNVFRVRLGRVRIIYSVDASKVRIIRTAFRSEDTYRD